MNIMAVVNGEEARESVEWLLHIGPPEIGRAEAAVESANLKRKAVFSIKMGQASGIVAEREAAAYQSQEFKDAAQAEADAIQRHRELRALQMGHKVRVDAWQTACANYRAAEKGFGSADKK